MGIKRFPKKEKRPVKVEVAPTKREALVPAEPIAPPMTIESMLPVEIDEEALKVYRDHKEQVIEAVQVKMLERLSPGLIDRFMGKRGLTDYKLLDEILRLERGQATSNVNVAYFDGNIALVKKEIERLEAERQKLLGDSNAIRDQESPGGMEGIQSQRGEEQTSDEQISCG